MITAARVVMLLFFKKLYEGKIKNLNKFDESSAWKRRALFFRFFWLLYGTSASLMRFESYIASPAKQLVFVRCQWLRWCCVLLYKCHPDAVFNERLQKSNNCETSLGRTRLLVSLPTGDATISDGRAWSWAWPFFLLSGF